MIWKIQNQLFKLNTKSWSHQLSITTTGVGNPLNFNLCIPYCNNYNNIFSIWKVKTILINIVSFWCSFDSNFLSSIYENLPLPAMCRDFDYLIWNLRPREIHVFNISIGILLMMCHKIDVFFSISNDRWITALTICGNQICCN